MNQNISNRRWMISVGALFLLIIAGMIWWSFTYTTSWKEELLLHDGSKIIVERSYKQSPFGRSEIGQPAPRVEEGLKFTVPGTKTTIYWKSAFGVELQDSLSLLMIDFDGDVPYITTTPVSCQSYNKWDRPNPAYVFFKYNGQGWHRIMIDDFPKKFIKANVLIGGYNPYQLSEKAKNSSFLSADLVREQNSHISFSSRYLRDFILEEVDFGPARGGSCEELIYYKGAWIMPDDVVAHAAMDRKEREDNDKWYKNFLGNN